VCLCAEGTTKLATVRATAPSTTCSGAPELATATCSACANLGKGTALSGTTAATCVSAGQSPCCNLPVFFLEYNRTTPVQFPYIEFNVLQPVRAHAGRPWTVAMTDMRV
jgi:hypothetical protein